MSKNKVRCTSKLGFTAIEVAIIMPIVALVILALISASLRLINTASSANLITKRSADLQAALDTIEQDISYSGGFLAEVECPDTNRLNCNGVMDGTKTMANVAVPNGRIPLILRTLMTTSNPISDSQNIKLVHMKEPNLHDCQTNPPAFANIIYYRQGASNNTGATNNLYRKVTINNAIDDSTCEKPWQKNTWSTVNNWHDFSFVDVANTSMPDTLLLEDAEIEVNYYNAVDPSTPLPSVVETGLSIADRQKILDEAISVEIVLRSKVSSIKGDRPTIITGRLRAHRI